MLTVQQNVQQISSSFFGIAAMTHIERNVEGCVS